MNHTLLFLFCFIFLATPSSFAQQQNNDRVKYSDWEKQQRDIFFKLGQKPVSGYKQFERANLDWENHLDKDGYMFNYAAENMQQYLQLKDVTVPSGSEWDYMGPYGTGGNNGGSGRINCIQVFDEDTWFVGASGGGLWKTDNSGVHIPGVFDHPWQNLTDNMPILSISGIAVNPENENEIYILTGDPFNKELPSMGIYKTTNQGQTWTPTSLEFVGADNVYGYKLIFKPGSFNEMYACTNSGLYYTEDGWETKCEMLSDPTYDVEFNPADSDIVYASTDEHIYRKCCGALSFSLQDDGINEPTSRRIDLAVSPAEPNWIYALYVDEDRSLGGIYVSQNQGDNWQLQSNGNYNLSASQDPEDPEDKGQGEYCVAFYAHPDVATLVYYGCVNLWQSALLGISGSWGQISNVDIHTDYHALIVNPYTGNLIAGTDGGIYVSTDGGSSWENRNFGLHITEFYHLAVDNNWLVTINAGGGSQDNGTMQSVTVDGTINDELLRGGDGFEVAINTLAELTPEYYTESQNGKLYFYGVRNGLPFFDGTIYPDLEEIETGIEEKTNRFDTPYEVNPNEWSELIIGYDDLYYSNDIGVGWTKMWDVSDMTSNSGVTAEITDVDFPDGNLAGFIVELSNDNNSCEHEVWVTTQIAQMIVLSDFTLWDRFEMEDLGVPGNSCISDISLRYYDDNGPNVYGMALSLAGYDSAYKVLYLPDFTAHPDSILNLTFDLPNVPVLCIEQHETGIYIGTDIGVFYLAYGSTAWQYHNNGLPIVPVSEIQFKETLIDGEMMYISTYGRGIWRNFLAEANPTKYFVDIDATGSNDGTTWANAFTSLSNALSIAEPQDTLWIAEGIYYPGTLRTQSFLIDGEKLFGGFDGTETMLSERNPVMHISRLSGNIGSAGVATDNSYRLLAPNYYNNHCQLDGITFSDGYANGTASDQKIGACFKVTTKTPGDIVPLYPLRRPHFTNCIFENFYANTSGGVFQFEDYTVSVYDFGGEVPEIPVIFDTCIFRNNYAQYGGAIYNDNSNLFAGDIGDSEGDANFNLNNCTFENNDAQYGGAIYADGVGTAINKSFSNLIFTGNTATENGGAIYSNASNGGDVSFQFTDCTFDENNANESGGAIFNYCGSNNSNYQLPGHVDMTYDNCIFTTNTAGNSGGAVCDQMKSGDFDKGTAVGVFTNCNFDSNNANTGGAFFANNNSYTSSGLYTFDNCTLNNNNSGIGGAIRCNGDHYGHSELILNNTSFTNSNGGAWGGAVYGDGNVEGYFSILVDSCLFENCSAEYGGALLLNSSPGIGVVTSVFANTIFNTNHADGPGNGSNGGAVRHYGNGLQTGSYSNCTFNGNHSNQRAGAIGLTYGDIAFIDCNFVGNYSSNQGGALYMEHAASTENTTSFDNCIFDANYSYGQGGAIMLPASSANPLHLPITNCQFLGNNAYGGGGAIKIQGGGWVDLDLNTTTFNDNYTVTTGNGGALYYVARGTVDIVDCIFDGNSTLQYGGAATIYSSINDLTINISDTQFMNGSGQYAGGLFIQNDNSTNIVADIVNCTFENNQGNLGIGALLMSAYDYCDYNVEDCSFIGNDALSSTSSTGAAAFASYSTTDTSDVRIFNCGFDDNHAVGAAGALHLGSDGCLRSVVESCSFTNNTTNLHGGAIRVYTYANDYNDADIVNCLFENNTATSLGGAISFEANTTNAETRCTANQCVFNGNTASDGGAIYAYSFSNNSLCDVDVRNSSIYGNHATAKCGGLFGYRANGTCTVQCNNNIVWNNTDADTEVNEKQLYKVSTATFTSRNSNVKDGLNAGISDGGGNITSDPIFINAMDADGADNLFATPDDGFGLQETSPCIDTASELYSTTTDIANTPRPQLNGYDIGAYESLAAEPELCFGDLNDDGVVNTTDLLLFMSAFGCTSSCGIYDLNGDGVVNTTDLLLFMSAFGNVCE